MKLILILGLIATAHCGTEHRRTARAKTTRSDMSHQIGDVDSDSARQRDLKTLLKSGEEKSLKDGPGPVMVSDTLCPAVDIYLKCARQGKGYC